MPARATPMVSSVVAIGRAMKGGRKLIFTPACMPSQRERGARQLVMSRAGHPRFPRPAGALRPLANSRRQAVEQQVDHRRGEQVSTWLTIRPPKIAMPSGRRSSDAGAGAQASAAAAEKQGGQRGHQDGPEPQHAGLMDGVTRRHALLALGNQREVDHHDRVLLHDADQQHDADDADDIQVRAAPPSAPAARRRPPMAGWTGW